MKATQLHDLFRNTLLSIAKKDKTWLPTRDAVAARKEGLDPHFRIENEVLLWKGRWYIPDDIDLKNMILHDNHDSKIAGHFGIYKTLERLKHNYHWHRMEEDIKHYVRACDTCQRDKPSRHRRYGQLEPLEVPYRPWSWGTRLYLHAVCPWNFLSSAEDATRVRGCYKLCVPSVGGLRAFRT